jgi:hypothetical protein
MALTVSKIFWPSARTPMMTSSEIVVAVRSSPYPHHGREAQRYNRFLGQRAGIRLPAGIEPARQAAPAPQNSHSWRNHRVERDKNRLTGLASVKLGHSAVWTSVL